MLQTENKTAELENKLSTEPIFEIARVFNASRTSVWKAFTDPERMIHWWGPSGFTVTSASMDLRPKGIFHYSLRSPEGTEMWGKFVYQKIQPPEQLVFFNYFSDRTGGVTRHPWVPTWPLEMITTLTFTEQKGKTTLTIKWVPINETDIERKTFEESQDKMTQGWTGTLDRLSDYLAKAPKDKEPANMTANPEKETVFARVIEASPESVFKAWTDPKELTQWWGPDGFTTSKCELDIKPNGVLRIDMKGPDRTVYPMVGTYKQVSRPQKLVFSGIPLDKKGSPLFETLNTVTFTRQNGMTTLILRVKVLLTTPEAEPYLRGMQQGWTQSLQRLSAYEETKKKEAV